MYDTGENLEENDEVPLDLLPIKAGVRGRVQDHLPVVRSINMLHYTLFLTAVFYLIAERIPRVVHHRY